MAKLYSANLLVLYPSDLGSCRRIKDYKSESVIMEKTLFGYREVYTKHPLKLKYVLEKNYDSSSNDFPYNIRDEEVYRELERGNIQCVLDKQRTTIREAEEQDAMLYVSFFPHSALNKKYSQEKERKEEAAKRKKEEKESKAKAKMLIKRKTEYYYKK